MSPIQIHRDAMSVYENFCYSWNTGIACHSESFDFPPSALTMCLVFIWRYVYAGLCITFVLIIFLEALFPRPSNASWSVTFSSSEPTITSVTERQLHNSIFQAFPHSLIKFFYLLNIYIYWKSNPNRPERDYCSWSKYHRVIGVSYFFIGFPSRESQGLITQASGSSRQEIDQVIHFTILAWISFFKNDSYR